MGCLLYKREAVFAASFGGTVPVSSLKSSYSPIWPPQQVDVYLTQTTVKIFFGTRITSHLCLYSHNQYSTTVEDHIPLDYQAHLQWNGERFLHWAGQISQHTWLFLSTHKVDQRSLKICMALLKLTDCYSLQRMAITCRPPSLTHLPTI